MLVRGEGRKHSTGRCRPLYDIRSRACVEPSSSMYESMPKRRSRGDGTASSAQDFRRVKVNPITVSIKTDLFPFIIDLHSVPGQLWNYKVKEGTSLYRIAPPSFDIDNELVESNVMEWGDGGERQLPHGPIERMMIGRLAQLTGLRLEVIFRFAKDSPVVCFKYRLIGGEGR